MLVVLFVLRPRRTQPAGPGPSAIGAASACGTSGVSGRRAAPPSGRGRRALQADDPSPRRRLLVALLRGPPRADACACGPGRGPGCGAWVLGASKAVPARAGGGAGGPPAFGPRRCGPRLWPRRRAAAPAGRWTGGPAPRHRPGEAAAEGPGPRRAGGTAAARSRPGPRPWPSPSSRRCAIGRGPPWRRRPRGTTPPAGPRATAVPGLPRAVPWSSPSSRW